jgi:hypothetical protein
MREGAHHGGGRFIQSNRASLANVTAKRQPLATARCWLGTSKPCSFKAFLRPHLATRSKTRGDNLRHSGEANRIINRAVACWVLFADPIAKLRGARRESDSWSGRLGNSRSRSPRNRRRCAAEGVVVCQAAGEKILGPGEACFQRRTGNLGLGAETRSLRLARLPTCVGNICGR